APLHFLIDCAIVIIIYGISAPLSFEITNLTGDLFTLPYHSHPPRLGLPLYWDRYLNLVPLLLQLPIAQLYVSRRNHQISTPCFKKILLRSAIPCLLMAGILFALLFVFPDLRGAICFIITFIVLSWPLFAINKMSASWFMQHDRGKSNLIKFVLIVGTNDKALKTAHLIDTHSEWGMRVVGFLSNDKKKVGHRISNHVVIGRVDHLDNALNNKVIDCVLFEGDKDYLSKIDMIVQRCETQGLDFAFTTSTHRTWNGNVFIENLGDISMVFIKYVFQNPTILFIKSVFDFLASSILIFLCLPLCVVLPILIRADSPGHILFRQERVGKNGRRFIMYKFRSMVADAEQLLEKVWHLNEMDGPAFKIKNDPRLTRIGRFLRKTSLDELPQLFNVFKGDISLVGPRPPIFKEVRQYRPWEKKRLSVKQGITCLWQVSGRNDIRFDEWMKLDLMYIDKWSFALDLKILIKTIPAILSRRGAR
ncbi:MAG: sugar transferase, partial [Desulfobacterales bacterium]|nr:sugar transferase [Desulfobacterales bacterium]